MIGGGTEPASRVSSDWLQVFRDITRATDERTCLFAGIPECGVGNSAPVVSFANEPAVAAALIMGNVNSIPLDWAARMSVGGVHMNFFIVKQLPVLPPRAYLGAIAGTVTYAAAVARRVLQLAYTTNSMRGFANDLGYTGPPFPWDESVRHRLKCELDAIFARLYRLHRSQLEWILDSELPGVSFPTLKRNEEVAFDEYRTRRYVLRAFDQLQQGELPSVSGDSSQSEPNKGSYE